MTNAITIDVEEYFHPSEVQSQNKLKDWDRPPSRVEYQTLEILELLARHNVKATFFVLGWVAKRKPHLIAEIAQAGHEIGCHSYAHKLVYALTPDQFREDTRLAMSAIEDACGLSPKVYRAPSYSITRRSLWALEILIENGFTADSSIYPIVRDQHGIPGFPRHATEITTPSGKISEIPVAPSTLSRSRLAPIGEGGDLRLLPYRYTASGLRKVNEEEGQPACVYFHAWEFDADQPRLARGLLSRARTYSGLRTMSAKLDRLLTEFSFSSIGEVYSQQKASGKYEVKGLAFPPSPRPTATGPGGAAAVQRPEVLTLVPEWHVQWDQYVQSHPLGTPFHLTAWMQSITETFGYKPMYAVAIEDGAMSGIFPLFLVDVPLRAKALISTPFAVYGGPLANSEAVNLAFRDYALNLGKDLGVDYVELRNGYEQQSLGFTPLSRYVTFTQDINRDEEELLNAIPRKTRAVVRKALKSNFETQRQNEDISVFYDLYSSNLRRLGTPSFPEAHFRNLIRNFGNDVDIREVTHEGEVAAAVLSFYFRDQVLPYYGAADGRFNALGATSFMYFDQMRSAAEEGCRVFDFGRSKKEGSGSYDFKAHWGMLERELPYEIALIDGKELPNYSPNNPKYRAFIRMWQNLPLWITRKMGPPLVRLFP